MIRHYFKIALRNLWKYKTQNFISVIGLAVGLLCFMYLYVLQPFCGNYRPLLY